MPTRHLKSPLSSKPDERGKGFRVQGRRFSTLNTTLTDLITFSYGIQKRQIVGGPDWMTAEKFDIDAQPDGEGQPNDKQWKSMLEKLLADRFQLKFHHEQRELPVYAMVVAKNGPKFDQEPGRSERPSLAVLQRSRSIARCQCQYERFRRPTAKRSAGPARREPDGIDRQV
jgi:uncharacterized protein (TIGR03435 family)